MNKRAWAEVPMSKYTRRPLGDEESCEFLISSISRFPFHRSLLFQTLFDALTHRRRVGIVALVATVGW
jgi:hypothetical protein